jgi:hypothetical protein
LAIPTKFGSVQVQQFRWLIWILLMTLTIYRVVIVFQLPSQTPVWVKHASSYGLIFLWILQGLGLWFSHKIRKPETFASIPAE